MSLDSNCSKFGQTNLIFFAWCCLAVGVVLCMPGQYRVFPPLAAIFVTRRRSMLATRRCKSSTGISVHSSSRAWQSSPRLWGGLSILMIARPNSSQMCSRGVAVWRSCRLLHLGDVALLKKIKDYMSMVMCCIIVLVATVIPELLPDESH